jgi:hypothetical protein
MSNLSRPAAALLLAAVTLAACSGGPGTASSPSTPADTAGATPTPAPTIAGIVHPTGATDVVLRFDEAGGFVPVEFMAAHVPYFTLYGDGTVVFVQNAPQVDPAPDNIGRGSPLRTGKLTEPQVQDLLQFALSQGGLGIAKADYPNPNVADAPTATFEIHADGGDKTVSVMALGMDGPAGPDTAIKASLAQLGERLRDFDRGGTLTSDPFTPAAYRAVLTDATGNGVAGRPWPWPSVKLDGFTFPADPNALRQGTRVLSADEVAALGIKDIENGVQSGVYVTGPDQKLYSLVVRPLLPDEQA